MEKHKETPNYEEQQCVIEKERLKLMSELATQMEIRVRTSLFSWCLLARAKNVT